MAEVLLLPFALLIAGGCLAYAMGRFEVLYKKRFLAGTIAFLFFLVALVVQIFSALPVWNGEIATATIGGTLLRMDALSVFLSLTALVLGTVVCLYSIVYMKDDRGQEYYYLLLMLMVAGIVGLSFSTDFLVLYLFFELMSIPSYALVAFRRHDEMAVEAGMKYIVMSAVGSVVAIFGISLIYIQTGSLQFSSMIGSLQNVLILQMALVLLIVGFGVKAAIVPMHTWLPDAHSAAPSGISAMLSGIVIAAGFFTLLRSLLVFTGSGLPIGQILIILSLVSMTVGNIMAFSQLYRERIDLKRILAYSSIAQMGYIILGIGVGMAYGISTGYEGGLFHIMTHAFMKGLAFLCAGVLIHQLGTRYLNEMQGIGFSMKVTGFTLSLALLSLAGVPPFSGFMSEWLVFSGAISTYAVIGWIGILIAAIALVNALVSLGYYLPIIRTLYLNPLESNKEHIMRARDPAVVMMAALVVLAGITLILGIWPEIGLRAVTPAVNALLHIGGSL